MIRYDPFWKTLKEKQISQYMLTEYYEISSSTLSKMKHNQICSLHTIDRLCGILDCTIPDIVEYYKEDDYYFNETNGEGMANVHQIGDKFDIHTSQDDGTPISLEVSVTEVQTADDLSLLSNKDAIPDAWHELVGPDGKLTSFKGICSVRTSWSRVSSPSPSFI